MEISFLLLWVHYHPAFIGRFFESVSRWCPIIDPWQRNVQNFRSPHFEGAFCYMMIKANIFRQCFESIEADRLIPLAFFGRRNVRFVIKQPF